MVQHVHTTMRDARIQNESSFDGRSYMNLSEMSYSLDRGRVCGERMS